MCYDYTNYRESNTYVKYNNMYIISKPTFNLFLSISGDYTDLYNAWDPFY